MYETTSEWDLYQKGLNYKSKISLLPTVDKAERFYAGRQWEGLRLNKLSPIVLNVVKKIADFKRSVVASSDYITLQFSADGVSDNTDDVTQQIQQRIAAELTGYAKTLWENLKVDSMNEDGLLNAQISGDMISYWFWDERIRGSNGQIGDINGELINNVNYFPGDPNNPQINDAYGPIQPYIILSFRRQVSDIRKEAKENGVKDEDLQNIAADGETENQAGDRAKIELDADGEDGKCIVLLKLWKEQDEAGQWHIMAKRSTRSVVIRDEWDTGLTRYPVALMNWTKREGSAHGEADLTSMIPNQIAINITASMIDSWVRKHGYPKVLYDKSRISPWTNDISTAIAVNSADGVGGVGGAAQYMQPAQLSGAVIQYLDKIILLTKELSGANESALGESAPTNTSAIITNVQSATRPLSSQKRRFYQYCEDVGLIWLDFVVSKYTQYPGRTIEVTTDGVKQVVQLDTETLKDMRLKLKLDIGPSTQWNEQAAVQTLDNLLTNQMITFIEYLKRVPNGYIPNKQGLINDRESAETQQRAQEKQLMYTLMAMFMEQIEPTLPPEAQSELKMLQRNDPQGYENQVKQLITQQAQQPERPETQPRPYADNVEGVM